MYNNIKSLINIYLTGPYLFQIFDIMEEDKIDIIDMTLCVKVFSIVYIKYCRKLV